MLLHINILFNVIVVFGREKQDKINLKGNILVYKKKKREKKKRGEWGVGRKIRSVLTQLILYKIF